MKSHNIKSPLSGSSRVEIVRKIPTVTIREKYKKKFQIDVSQYFNDVNEIVLFKDLTTDYMFYYPFNVNGDDKFYEELQKFDWYYMPWKWEHRQCYNLIQNGDKILEVGCAKGDFLKVIKQRKEVDVVGLELNRDAVINAKAAGLNVKNEFVEEHAKHHLEEYDLVCSFQVLEHINDVNSFIGACIDSTKKGGKILFSVPNNNSFSKYDWKNDILNMPPHHMGQWTKKSFKNLTNLFNIELERILFEPLQEYHIDWYSNVLYSKYFSRYPFNNTKFRNTLEKFVKMFHSQITGHTIVAVYTKKF